MNGQLYIAYMKISTQRHNNELRLANVDMNANSQQKDANQSKIDKCMNKYSRSTCVEATKLHRLVAAGDLNEQPRR
ncbi:hypothetical protein BVRB_6g131410 [Beta vulgaris subsp. vulgaris]|nr:hypothetical protein BVRB_6g131410 [Beta vulgaris subsp. vulgaris]